MGVCSRCMLSVETTPTEIEASAASCDCRTLLLLSYLWVSKNRSVPLARQGCVLTSVPVGRFDGDSSALRPNYSTARPNRSFFFGRFLFFGKSFFRGPSGFNYVCFLSACWPSSGWAMRPSRSCQANARSPQSPLTRWRGKTSTMRLVVALPHRWR